MSLMLSVGMLKVVAPKYLFKGWGGINIGESLPDWCCIKLFCLDLKIALIYFDSTSAEYFIRPYVLEASNIQAGNTKGGSITVPLTSCLTSLD